MTVQNSTLVLPCQECGHLSLFARDEVVRPDCSIICSACRTWTHWIEEAGLREMREIKRHAIRAN